LYSEYLSLKQITIYSIGKISIKDNIKYLEKAFEKYYNKNPIICSRLLCEIKWLDDEKYTYYYSLLKNNRDLINSMTLSLSISSENYSYEIMVQNIQNKLKQKDWTKEEYIKSIKYYKDYGKKIIYTDYVKLYNDILKYE
jgi:hypothetical protein